jgi:putative flippase GtrA
MHRILKFLLTGVSNTFISLVVFSLLVRTLPATPAMTGISQIASYASGILWSFMLNHLWVFRGVEQPRAAFPRFLAVQIACMLTSAGAIAGTSRAIHVQPELIWLVVMAAITILNFTLLQKWVFKPA